MKRILAFLLVLVMCVGLFAACGEKVPVERAVEYLRQMSSYTGKELKTDFDVVGKIVVDGAEFTVTWTADTDKVKIVKSDMENFWTVDLPEANAEKLTWKLTATVKGKSGEKTVEFKPVLPVFDNSSVISAPTEGTAYKLTLYQGNKKQNLYVIDALDQDRYLKMSNDPKKGLDFFVEKDGEGYKIYATIGGAKKYVNAYLNDAGKTSLRYADEGSVFTFKADVNAWITTIDGTTYGIGTYGSYETVSLSDAATYYTPEKIDSQFVLGFITKEAAEAREPDKEAPPEIPMMKDPVKPVAGTAYRFGFVHGGNSNKVYYLTGAMDGYYGATTEDIAAGANVWVEETEGGYHLYWGYKTGAKSYINMVQSGTHTNIKFEETATTVYTYDETLKTFKSKIGDVEYIFGTSAFNTYTTIGPVKNNGAQFYLQFVAAPAGAEDALPPSTEGGDKPEGGDNEPAPTTGNLADFGTMKGENENSYTDRTSTNGWTAANAACQHKDFMGDASVYAITLNGKVGAAGKLTSPTLANGIKSLSFKYAFPFNDNQFKLTINIKKGSEVVATQVLEKTGLAKETVCEFAWTLDTPVDGEFTIEIVNESLSQSTSNKDRLSVWNLTWENK